MNQQPGQDQRPPDKDFGPAISNRRRLVFGLVAFGFLAFVILFALYVAKRPDTPPEPPPAGQKAR